MCRACGSRPVVGSSSSSSSGSLISERAIVTRRFMPPDSGSTRLLARSVSCTKSSSSAVRRRHLGARDVEVAAVQHEVLLDGELAVELVALGHDADPGPDPPAVDGRVETEDPQLAVGDRRDAADHAHRRRLAGAVRTEEPERLARCHLDVDAVDRGEVSEALDDLACRDEGT